jgi:hypothetical protein
VSWSAVRAAESSVGEVVELDPLTVYSDAVAMQQPATTFAMPVTLLRFEPLVDVQGRGMAEAQADISIRGGTFENTGFSIGALPVYDPQTGHYFAELPVAPAMLSAPTIRTGAEQAASGWNATAGGVAYGWSRIREGAHGFVNGTLGDNSLHGGEVYSSFTTPEKILGGRTVGFDVSAAASQGEGSRSFGDHDFARYAGRVQLADERSQTDFFAGYQSKFFGWPSLYAPFGTPETENLKTSLFAATHRVELGADGDFFEIAGSYRKNVDDYEFNRTTPGAINPFLHTTIVRSAAVAGRHSVGDNTALTYNAGVIGDDLDSTILTAGPFMSRTQYYAGLFGEQTFVLSEGREVVATAGARYDDTNREGSEVSPVVVVELRRDAAVLRRLYASYGESTQVATYTALNSPTGSGLFRGNPDLPRATAQNFEVGAEASAAGWRTRAAAFFRRDEGLLDYVFATPLTARSAVAVDLDTYGVELTARRSWKPVDVVLGYAFLHKEDDYTAPNNGSFYALNYAEHRFTAAFVARPFKGVEGRRDNEARFQAENALRSRGDDKLISSLGVSYAVPGVDGLTLSGQVDNLWNTYFEEVPQVPGARREWSVSATYAW